MKISTSLKISLLLLSIIFVLASCINNDNYYVFPYPINPSSIISTGNFQYATIFKSDSSVYEIKEMHNVGFELWFSNTDTIPGEMRIYISLPFDTIPFDDNFIRNNLTPVYYGATIPSGSQTFTPWVTSISRVTNQQTFFSHIMDGQFNLYFVPEPPNTKITLDSANIIFSASAVRDIY